MLNMTKYLVYSCGLNRCEWHIYSTYLIINWEMPGEYISILEGLIRESHAEFELMMFL